ncbi:hypothetical protein AVEN_254919-1 [Araneus ventricosus]|uniref:Uncharacterized protein n=1 Tax=Araneus ventricosus TaxID=182803 RepID=A0A4Y2NNG6_ARAVE|nr:hypothetical protein AVEN_254919-1 [Araneus ventricosus]
MQFFFFIILRGSFQEEGRCSLRELPTLACDRNGHDVRLQQLHLHFGEDLHLPRLFFFRDDRILAGGEAAFFGSTNSWTSIMTVLISSKTKFPSLADNPLSR